MATSPTSKSALLSGAAKDDAVGGGGDFTFTIQDLLANDPGGAAKVSLDSQFFFGSTAADQQDQQAYLDAHHIINNGDGTYTITSDSTDFDYFVQIGNKGTWSEAHVDVTAPEPVIEPHTGDLLFAENFDYNGVDPILDPATATAVAGVVNLNTASGWTGAEHTELGMNGYGGISTTSGGYWLDTHNSPGDIDISHTFNDPTGGQVQLSFDIAVQDLTFNNQNYALEGDALIEFKIDGTTVQSFTHDQLLDLAGGVDQMYHFEAVVNTGAAGEHTFSIVDSTPNAGYAGFAVDSIAIHDWIV
jgi:hypothetical protein